MYYPTTLKRLIILATVLVASGCSDSSLQETGFGAGDGNIIADNPAAVTLILPFAGIYDLQDDWNGQAGDQAYLSILEPETNGIAQARLIDFDDVENCVPKAVLGVVSKDPTSNRIFLDKILDLNDSELFLSGSVLTIELADEIDRNGNLDTLETVSISAKRIGLTESDLGVACF